MNKEVTFTKQVERTAKRDAYLTALRYIKYYGEGAAAILQQKADSHTAYLDTMPLVYEYSSQSLVPKATAIDALIVSSMECDSLIPEDTQELVMRAGEKSNQMQTHWFWGSYIWDYCEQQIIEECKKGLYLLDGSFYKWIEDV